MRIKENELAKKASKAGLLILVFLLTSVVGAGPQATAQGTELKSGTEPAARVVLASDVVWGPLNPARGDQGPKAGTLWGDRTGSGPSGFLVEFVDGFSSPPHIHNVSYRGVVISGLVHNDDPDAEELWLPAGSFWTQPAGAAHITSADGSHNLVYVEIDEGPYLVQPAEEAFENGEQPVNVGTSNIVWLDASNSTWLRPSGTAVAADAPEMAFLWGNPQGEGLTGALVKLPAGFAGAIQSHGLSLRAVVIQGRPQYREPGGAGTERLTPGSYFGAREASKHEISCGAETCLIYVRVQGTFEVVATGNP